MKETESEALKDFSPQGGFRNKPGNIEGLKEKPGFEYIFDESWLNEEPELPLYLDIGAGMGRFLMAEAAKSPESRFIGIDPDYQCSKRVLQKLDNRKRRDAALERVRYFHGSIYFLLEKLPDACVDRAYVNYPDPWFKRKHLKRRLVSLDLFAKLKRVLKPKADVYVQTDIDAYRKEMEDVFENLQGFQQVENAETFFANLTTTLYQEKAAQKNHSRFCYILRYCHED